MDTRSRSRSNTPFTGIQEYAKEFIEKESYAEQTSEQTIVRSTRSTTYRTEEGSAMSTDEVTTVIDKPKLSRKSTKSERNVRKLYKTSDYSSEEGETEVSSSRSISQNDKNQLIEDARAAANGSSEVSALDLYKRSGRYWDVYPKTDWTYSPHSKDRVELAPGVVAMPNMSRKAIHSFSDKHTNTETFSLHKAQDFRPRQLFNNNHEYETRETKVTRTYSRWRRTLAVMITSVVAVCQLSFRVQTAWFAKLHRFASRVMLWDTWLLWKSGDVGGGNRKTARLVALCLLPLLLLGGWYTVTHLGSLLYAPQLDAPLLTIPSPEETTPIPIEPPITNIPPEIPVHKTAPELSEEQLNALAIAINSQAAKLEAAKLEAAHLEAAQQRTIVDGVSAELRQLKATLEELQRDQLHSSRALAQLQLRGNLQLSRCCRRNALNFEGYMRKLLDRELSGKLGEVYVAREDFEARLGDVAARLHSKLESSAKLLDEMAGRVENHHERSGVGLAENEVRRIVGDVLRVYDADKTGLVDYAMETMGGQVLSTRCTEVYRYGKGVVSILGVPLWHPVNSPRTVITPSIHPGECWAFQNFPGFVVIRLSKRVRLQAFSLEHISRLLAPDGDIDSSPKEFQVFGLSEEDDKDPVLLGEYVYDVDGEPLQFFAVQNEGHVFDVVELRVLSNNGNPNYTCLYRFRVHGKCVA